MPYARARAELVTVAMAFSLGAACEDPSGADADPGTTTPESSGTTGDRADACAALEQQIAAAIDAAAVDPTITDDPNLTLLLETNRGHTFTHVHGDSSPTRSYESASTSKLVATVVILDLVDREILTLDSRPHDLISFWTDETTMTLRDLLSFRSGFHDEPLLCDTDVEYESCVQASYEMNVDAGIAPGTQFYYASTHLRIAGLMAMNAAGQSWADIFAAWSDESGLFPNGQFDLPSLHNPRLAGGMHWTGEEYLAFLRALAHGDLLSDAMRSELFADQRGQAVVTLSPLILALDEDWAYGLGNWLECPTAIGPDTFDCGSGHRNSSPGAYGAYPFIDFDHGYFGILARQGALGTFSEGLAIFRASQDLVGPWAQACG